VTTDFDALAERVRDAADTLYGNGDFRFATGCNDAQRELGAALDDLVAIAKEATERAERAEVRREVACTELRTRVERAERERDDARRLADDITYTEIHVAASRARAEAAEARVAELAQLLVEWRSGLVSSGGYGGGLKQRTDVALATHDQKEGIDGR